MDLSRLLQRFFKSEMMFMRLLLLGTAKLPRTSLPHGTSLVTSVNVAQAQSAFSISSFYIIGPSELYPELSFNDPKLPKQFPGHLNCIVSPDFS